MSGTTGGQRERGAAILETTVGVGIVVGVVEGAEAACGAVMNRSFGTLPDRPEP